jgi:hypothetical protein
MATVTTWGRLADGRTCISETAQGFASQAEADAANRLSAMRDWEVPPACVNEEGAVVVLPQPEDVALQFWQQVTLPAPEPRIAPDYAITGKTAYLETGSEPTASFSFDTELGRLTISAQDALRVDWGDGTGLVGPFDSVGGAWPNGDITHVYDHAGAVDVRVRQDWTATWVLTGPYGDASGTLGGLQTEGVIPNFDVRQVQAVIG